MNTKECFETLKNLKNYPLNLSTTNLSPGSANYSIYRELLKMGLSYRIKIVAQNLSLIKYLCMKIVFGFE